MIEKRQSWLNSVFESNKKLAFLFIVPSLLIIFGVMLYPMLYSLSLSFQKIDFVSKSNSYVGLEHYLRMFQDSTFLSSAGITIYFTFIAVLAELAIGIAIALVLNQKFHFRGFVRGIIILPWALPSVVNAIMWKWIFNSNYRALNALLTQLRITGSYKLWLGDPTSALNALIYANIWKETPYVV